jgi:hypothetical protein
MEEIAMLRQYFPRLTLLGLVLACLAGSVTNAPAAESTCTTCTPPTGVQGYRWFTAHGSTSFTCHVGDQTITHTVTSLLVGIRADGSLGALRFSNGFTHQVFISGTADCDIAF